MDTSEQLFHLHFRYQQYDKEYIEVKKECRLDVKYATNAYLIADCVDRPYSCRLSQLRITNCNYYPLYFYLYCGYYNENGDLIEKMIKGQYKERDYRFNIERQKDGYPSVYVLLASEYDNVNLKLFKALNFIHLFVVSKRVIHKFKDREVIFTSNGNDHICLTGVQPLDCVLHSSLIDLNKLSFNMIGHMNSMLHDITGGTEIVEIQSKGGKNPIHGFLCFLMRKSQLNLQSIEFDSETTFFWLTKYYEAFNNISVDIYTLFRSLYE